MAIVSHQAISGNNLKSRIEQLEQENAALLAQPQNGKEKNDIDAMTLQTCSADHPSPCFSRAAADLADSGGQEPWQVNFWFDPETQYSTQSESDGMGRCGGGGSGDGGGGGGGGDPGSTESHIQQQGLDFTVMAQEQGSCEQARQLQSLVASSSSSSSLSLSSSSSGMEMEHSRALHLAVESGNRDCVSLLIDNGWNINSRDISSGLTPLMVAVTRNDPLLIQVLLMRGAEVNTRGGPDDISALELAAKLGHSTAVEALLTCKKIN